MWIALPGLKTLDEINAKYRSIKDDDDNDDDDDDEPPPAEGPPRRFAQVWYFIKTLQFVSK